MKRFFFALLVIVQTVHAQQLVLPGDHPDPSVVKIGDTYWASATSSNWMPIFPLLQSKDLVNWKLTGHVFQQPPAWSDYYFWAPEVTYDKGKVYIYYSAHRKGGNLCLSVASADRPEGPYKDHGPLICQAVGSIDAFPMRDKSGKLFLIWKEDANSVNLPTPIWIQEMNEERTAMLGEKRELFRNNLPWEANLVEGVSMIQQGEYYYAFYAAAGCCGPGCTYATGVARAKDLQGPWEKYSGNPILTHNEQWRCPGHGTPVVKDGRFYFLYHGYNAQSTVFTGREGLLQEFRFTPDGWVEFIKAPGAIQRNVSAVTTRFRKGRMPQTWEWNVFQQPRYKVANGELNLAGFPVPSGQFAGQKTLSGDYTATAVVRPRKTDADAGISVLGDEQNTLNLYYTGDSLVVSALKGGRDSIIAGMAFTAGRNLQLRVQAQGGNRFTFAYSTGGNNFTPVNTTPIDGSYLPPWDRALRVGVSARGREGTVAVFDKFVVDPQ